MKRFFPIFLLSALTVVFLLFAGCSTQEQNEKLTVKESISACYEALLQHTSQDDSGFQQVSHYLSSWAEENDIDVKTSNDKYIVLSKAASVGYEDAETFTLHTEICLDSQEEKEKSMETVASLMTALYSAENHGTLKGIVTLEKNGRAAGASVLSDKYAKGDNFIHMQYSGKTKLYNSVATSSEVMASCDLHMESPQYTKAYKIVLEGTPYKSAYKYRSDYPNAIKTIGDLLASCQSSSVLFELASFKGGNRQHPDLYPAKATAVIVLQENDVESFTKRFEKSYEKVEEYYNELEEPFQYTMTETKLPKKVISREDSGNIVSLMYTIINGTYLKSDEGKVMAVSNIGHISTGDRQFRLTIHARSLENTLMDEMHTIIRTTCGLCDIKYRKLSSSPLWYSAPDTPLIQALSTELKTEPSGTLEDEAASVFLRKNPELNLAIWGTDKKDAAKNLPSLLEYMSSFGEQQNQ